MNKTIFNVPEGIRYISQWKDFGRIIPNGHCIINKVLCDCGATHWFLTNDNNVILIAPRNLMLESKSNSKELKDDVFWFRPGMDTELHNYKIRRAIVHKPEKILVTYDSLHSVLAKINPNLYGNYTIVVDEQQCLISDSAYKGDTEMLVVEQLMQLPNVIFLSATVFEDDYLDSIDIFKNMPYIQLHWPDSQTRPVQLQMSQMKSVPAQVKAIIMKYRLQGFFEEKLGYKATQAVFFINNVASIINIIKGNELNDSEVNILCSSDDDTTKKLKTAKLHRGIIPQVGEPHKTFTFVTRACYEGADFNHPNAYTYIFCNPQLKEMATDLYTEVSQCLGRQRLDSNPFKYHATLFYKTSLNYATEDEFKAMITQKDQETDSLLGIYARSNTTDQQLLLKQYWSAHERDGFRENYLTVVKQPDGSYKPYKNGMVRIAEERAWYIQSQQYSSKLRIIATLQQKQDVITTPDDSITNFTNEFAKDKSFERRMCLYCQFRDQNPNYGPLLEDSTYIPVEYHNYYNKLGHSAIRAHSYKESDLKQLIGLSADSSVLRNLIMATFKVGKCYLASDTKRTLQQIYTDQHIVKTAKATDLADYFVIKKTTSKDSSGKVMCGFRIIGLK